MVLPGLYTPSEPQIGEPVASGPARLTANFLALSDFLGIPTNPPNQLNAPAFSITGNGVVTIVQAGATVAGNPTGPLGIATKQYADRTNKAITTSSADAYAITNTTPLTTLVDGTLQIVKWDHTNTTNTPTLNVDGLGALNVMLPTTGPVLTGGLVANHFDVLFYDAASNQWIFAGPLRLAFRNCGAGGTPAVNIVNTTGATAIVNYAINANTLGAYGRFRMTLTGDYWNNSSVAGSTVPVLTAYLNGGLMFNTTTNWIAGINMAGNRQAVKAVMEVVNNGATNAQYCSMLMWAAGSQGPGILTATPSPTLQGWNQSTVDTTQNVSVQVNVQLPTANAACQFRLWDSYFETLN